MTCQKRTAKLFGTDMYNFSTISVILQVWIQLSLGVLKHWRYQVETCFISIDSCEDNQIVDLINRYTFASLLPCNSSYLNTLSKFTNNGVSLAEKCSQLNVSEKGSIVSSRVPLHQIVSPDLSKMAKIGEGGIIRDGTLTKRIPRGHVTLPRFSLNPALLDFMYKLPPPRGFWIDMDKVLSLIADMKMNELEEVVKKLKLEKSTMLNAKGEMKPGARANRPPPRDIFRRRQKSKKAKT